MIETDGASRLAITGSSNRRMLSAAMVQAVTVTTRLTKRLWMTPAAMLMITQAVVRLMATPKR